MPKTETAILSDEQVEEIAVRDWHLNGALEKRIALSPAERDALIAMVRTFNEHYENLMRAALLREQSAAEQARALCQTVRALRAENEKLNAIVSAYENQDEEALEEAENL